MLVIFDKSSRPVYSFDQSAKLIDQNPTKYITPFSLDLKETPQKTAEYIMDYRPKYIVIPKRLE